MAEDNIVYSIEVNEEIDNLLTKRYNEYLEKAKEEEENVVLTFEDFIFYIFKIGILHNEIRIHKTIKKDKEKEVGNINFKIHKLTEEYDNNRRKLKYSLF